MANNIFEQFDEAYSRWSLLDKVEKEMQRYVPPIITLSGYGRVGDI